MGLTQYDELELTIDFYFFQIMVMEESPGHMEEKYRQTSSFKDVFGVYATLTSIQLFGICIN